MHIEAIYTAPAAGEQMQSRESVHAIDGGLTGDRYCKGTGHYSPFDVCEVTVVQAEAIESVAKHTHLDPTDGQHRRNLVVRGGDVHDLLEETFSVGEARFNGTRPRPPCRYLEEVTGQSGLMDALANGTGGICARVVSPGTLSVGDTVHDRTASDDVESLVANIRERTDQ
jgi:MOSC domain-containing protein YiiM